MLAWPDGSVKPLLFEGSELLPSAVLAEDKHTILVGRDAIHAARTRPECFEPYPKRAIDDGLVLLGGAEVTVTELFAAVLARVGHEARPNEQGLGTPNLVAEPVAAASYFVSVSGATIQPGQAVVVYDFGAGTFDASVVRHTATGFVVSAERGLPNVGGLDIDAAIMAYLGTVYAARDSALWEQLVHPHEPRGPTRRPYVVGGHSHSEGNSLPIVFNVDPRSPIRR